MHQVNFSAAGAQALAVFVAQLVREGVTFRVDGDEVHGWTVSLTGGF